MVHGGFLSGLNTKYLLVGDDFRFGRGREGDFELLEKAGSEKGFEVERAQTLGLRENVAVVGSGNLLRTAILN